ncbi:MAG: hypothetical protein FWH55_13830 [Oscillospiraceae bacterium]|nr:hypothetical protein [Oscillospiraceae bacterium]
MLYQDWLDIMGAEKILDWAKRGLPIVILGGAASRTPFNDGKETQLAEIITELKQQATIKTASVDNYANYFDGVAVGYEDDVYEKLQELGVRPYAELAAPNHQLLTQSRRDGEDNMYLYAFNYCTNDYHHNSSVAGVQTENHCTNIKTEIKIDGQFIPYAIDAWSGQVKQLANYRYENGQTVFHVDLDVNNIALFAFEAVDSEKLHIVETNAEYAYETQNGPVVRAIGSGIVEVALSNGVTYQNNVTAPAAFGITDWDLTVKSWTANAVSGDLMRTETIDGVTTTNRKTSTVKTNINVSFQSNGSGLKNPPLCV